MLKIHVEDYVNTFVGDWLIVGLDTVVKHEQHWIVKCSCGLITTRRAGQLTRGKTNSCRSCAAKKREGEKSYFWKGLDGISQQYLNRLTFRGKEVLITLQDLVDKWKEQQGLCAYSKEPLILMKKDTLWSESTASIDRIDSSMGYIKGNIQWVHKRINTMKNDMSEKEFISWCLKVSGGSCGS